MDNQKKIISKFNIVSGYAFLSNFHPSTIVIDKRSYPTVEHAYQAHKTIIDSEHETIRKATSPAIAKKLGRSIKIRDDWDEVKISLMRKFIKEKFKNPLLQPLLLDTKDYDLIFENTWNDRFWGVCRGSGLNWLGKILVEVREEILTSDVT